MMNEQGATVMKDHRPALNSLFNKYSYEQLVIIYVLGMCADLVRAGSLSGGTHKLSLEGEYVYQRMKKMGFEPTGEEIRLIMSVLQFNLSEGMPSMAMAVGC